MAALADVRSYRAFAWPAALLRSGVTPAVAGLWALHELVVGAAAAVPFPAGANPATWGLPWARFDVGWYAGIARSGYPPAHLQTAAYFPGVPAYLWLTHWPALALLGMQLVFLALLVQVGRLATAWGLAGWRVVLAQALMALAPAAGFYSTAYPEAWEALGLCGALLAIRANRPWAAAAWSALAGVMDPLGLLVGIGAGVWTVWGVATRDKQAARAGFLWGCGSVAGLAAVSGTLLANGDPAFAFIGAQRAWGAHWVWPGVQVWQALTTALGPESTTRLEALALLPGILVGVFVLVRMAPLSRWHCASAAIGLVLILVALAFYTNRAPLSSAARFLSLDVPAVVALAGVLPRRLVSSVTAWSAAWAVTGAVLFSHGWFWG